MDENNPISPLQSATIRAAVKAIAVNLLTLVTVATGKAFDVDYIQDALDQGVTLGINAISMYYAYKTIRGRMAATQIIKPKE